MNARGWTRENRERFRLWLLLISAFSLQPSAFAQSFSLRWHTIDGGGGTSTGGVFSVSGTIGQPDAGGPMTNGQYSVTGGFWVLPQVEQTEGAPVLMIVPFGTGQAKLTWTPSSTNWVLQERLSLNSGTWTNAVSGSTNPIIVPTTMPAKYYRLFNP